MFPSHDRRGHLGTELMNKSETVIKLTPDGNTSKVECHYARNRPFTSFDFLINDAALPCRLEYPHDTEFEPENEVHINTGIENNKKETVQSELSFETNEDDFLIEKDDLPF